MNDGILSTTHESYDGDDCNIIHNKKTRNIHAVTFPLFNSANYCDSTNISPLCQLLSGYWPDIM